MPQKQPTPEEVEAEEKEKDLVIRRVRSLLKLAACKDAGKKLSAKDRAAKQLEQWKEIFRACDRSGSGTLSFQDIKRMARTNLKIAERLVSDLHLRVFFDAIDEDGGGSVDFTEFLTFVNEVQEDSGLKERVFNTVKRTVKLALWKQHMAIEDVETRFYNCAEEGIVDMGNSDGSLGPEEMRRFFRKVLNISKHEAPDKNLVIAFQAMDEDGGGTLDADEFLDFIRDCLGEEPKGSKHDGYTPGLLAGINMRDSLPKRDPRGRPGTVQGHGISDVPFCLHGRDLLPQSRFSCSTPSIMRPQRMRPSRSEPALRANGLPSIIHSPRPQTDGGSRNSSALPSLASTARGGSMRETSKADKNDIEDAIRDNYLNMKGSGVLNRVEHWLFNAGVDVRGQYHTMSR